MAAGYSAAHRNARLDQFTTDVGNAGKLIIYAGTRPATGGAAGTVLSTHTLGTPFAAGAAAGVLTGNLPADVNASATGTASWGRITTSADLFIADYDVATSGAEITVNSTAFTSGVAVAVTAITITEGSP